MKINLSITQLLLGLFILVALIALFKVGSFGGKNEREKGISATGASTTGLKEINIVAQRFSFSPNPIKLKLNESVRFRITTKDVTHSFSVPELGIDKTVEPGKETVFEFTPTKTGKFLLLCLVECGTGHTRMRGSIIVE